MSIFTKSDRCFGYFDFRIDFFLEHIRCGGVAVSAFFDYSESVVNEGLVLARGI